MKIQALNRSSLDALLVFNESLMKASGRNGNPIYNPFDDTHPWESGRHRDTTIHRWETDVGQLGWGRSFGIIDDDGAIRGEAEVFHRYRLSTSLHRAEITIGLSPDIHNRGWGTKLLTHAIEWSTSRDFLRWLDLGVFSSNPAALRLYRKLGFVERGRMPDAFRVFGVTVEDVQLSLDLATRR
jgi:RimJ/RimL family protein N-acetyltransferase